MITDNQNEIFDVVNEDDIIVGQATRREVHGNKNLIHRSIGVVIFNSKGEIYLQQRSATKDTDPLKWTISCSGHVNKGETYKETVLRELKEELGLNIIFPISLVAQRNGLKERQINFEFVAKYICRAANETEMQVLYQAINNGPFKLNKEEIIQGKFFTRKTLVKLVKSGKLELSFIGKVALGKSGWIHLDKK